MLEKMGQASRTFALQNFVSEICMPKVIEVIENEADRGFHLETLDKLQKTMPKKIYDCTENTYF